MSKNFRMSYVDGNVESISAALYVSTGPITVLCDDGYGWFLHHDSTQHITVSAFTCLHTAFTVRQVAQNTHCFTRCDLI
jgi:hypothetical protein